VRGKGEKMEKEREKKPTFFFNQPPPLKPFAPYLLLIRAMMKRGKKINTPPFNTKYKRQKLKENNKRI